jgi:hypothetical protein
VRAKNAKKCIGFLRNIAERSRVVAKAGPYGGKSPESARNLSVFRHGQAKDKGTVTKLKLADRGLNMERLGRHFKLSTDKYEVAGSDELICRLEAGRKRLQT